MSYTRPSATAANASWESAVAYTRPLASAADATWEAGSGPSTTPVSVAITLPGLTLAAVADTISPVTASVTLPTLSVSVALIPPVNVDVAITLPGLSLSATVLSGPPVSVSATLPGLSLTATAEYDSRTSRPTVATTRSEWQVADTRDEGVTDAHQDADRLPTGYESRWTPAARADSPTRFNYDNPDRLHQSRSTRFENARRSSAATNVLHQDADRTRNAQRSGYDNAIRTANARRALHQDADRLRLARSSEYENAVRVAEMFAWGIEIADDMRVAWQSIVQNAMRPPAGRSSTEPPIEPPGEVCYVPSPHLVFAKLPGSDLLFICDNYVEPTQPTVVVPLRDVYMVINDVSLKRVSNNLFLPTVSMSLKIDAASWTWGFDATLPASVLPDLEPVGGNPVELEVEINGNAYRVLAESISRDRSFAQSTIRVSGRGKSAHLDSPYSPILTFGNTIERTAQQLMGDALTLNGVSVGWSVDWQLTDWLVPAGVWSHQGSYISALKTIAESVGGYLQPHPTAQTMRVLPRYAAAPWAWDGLTPDFELPAALTTREGIEWRDAARYNAVFVSGQQQGILGHVKRTGTAGDLVAPMVVHPLITHADAARQRGISILSDTGRQAHVSLRIPVLPETGIIEPGAFIQYVDGGETRRGVVRSTEVSVGYPEVFQSLGVETHA